MRAPTPIFPGSPHAILLQRPGNLKRRFYLRWPFGLAVAAVIGYGVAVAMHWDDRGALWVKESFESTAARSDSVWLPDYQVDIDAAAAGHGR